eukprot:Skav211747  [mRNA]  locus=scaffold1548:465637:466560:- [translate_table: standard]
MKAMKKASPSAKGKPAPLAKGKAKAKKPLKKGLKKKDLNKLGQMTLKEKVKKLKEECSDEEAAAAELQLQLTPAEKSRGWSKHQTHLCKKGNENEKQEFDEASKKDKGFKTALFLLKTTAPSFCNVQQKAKTKNELIMREKWMSEKEAYDRFGDDLEKHLASGRVSWREDRRTWGTYEYLDNDDYERKVTGTKELEWSHFQEYEMGGGDEEHWGKHFDKDLQSLLLDHTPGKGSSLAKGSGKGKSKGKGKQGKGNPNPNPPKAIEDLPLDQQMPEALKKLKKTKGKKPLQKGILCAKHIALPWQKHV